MKETRHTVIYIHYILIRPPERIRIIRNNANKSKNKYIFKTSSRGLFLTCRWHKYIVNKCVGLHTVWKKNVTWGGGLWGKDVNFPPLMTHAASQLPHFSSHLSRPSPNSPWIHCWSTYSYVTQFFNKQKTTPPHRNSSEWNTQMLICRGV